MSDGDNERSQEQQVKMIHLVPSVFCQQGIDSIDYSPMQIKDFMPEHGTSCPSDPGETLN